ncbi:uncharacterized protein LOC664098 [Tribolium castaneum]|uniref:Uncharacterized protein n=1 Tax=Tribolium castaneum TaxID=7070 RepID=D6X008_TRICA|nr:PREDICTED: uncharacterized protein LOC664098 [Tribolium castaneum]EFA09612.1 hypothetical protein TcasGA2_TC011733 [Tribolium castaneum]|eukprot:XP_975208.1 PREDICTED: uncharacterized protein LOC664098 [Tribolium castaneum]
MALKYVAIAVVAFLCVETLSAFSLAKRSLAADAAANSSEVQAKEICQGRTPCGWAVYNKMTRFIDYFMRNKCECNKEKRCLRDDDDISITAYVYRCKIDDGQKSVS